MSNDLIRRVRQSISTIPGLTHSVVLKSVLNVQPGSAVHLMV